MHRAGGGLRYDGKIAGLYDLEETLGSGHFAIVKSARHVFTGEKVAVKVIDKSKLDEVSRAHLFQEVRCMKLVQHPNVVRLYEVIDTQTKLYLILELADGGDLYDYIMRHETGLAEDMAREYFRQIVRAISYCHRLHVVHRDLKPENVVFFETLGMVKLTDFGFSNRFNPGQKLETSCGSLAYSAPEILLGDSYDAPAVDVWSLGVILYMLVCGQAPFREANDSETLTMIMDVKYTIPSHVSEGCKRLIGRMLVREPERRASLAQIAADPWLGVNSIAAVSEPADFLPLVSREHVSDDNHALIIQKMVNGNIATKEDILEALDRNEYNHITATYFLLAERKLRAHRQEQAASQQRLRNQLPTPSAAKPSVKVDTSAVQLVDSPTEVDQSLLTARPNETGQNFRVRKCSIVQEEEDEDDISSAGHEEILPAHCSLNRRGSRSEGKLNLVLQERLAESERRKETTPTTATNPVTGIPRVGVCDDTSKPKSVWLPTGKRNLPLSSDKVQPLGVANAKWRMGENKKTSGRTSVIAEAATVPGKGASGVGATPRFKTMPSPTRVAPVGAAGALNEIFEEGDPEDGQVWACPGPARATPPRPPAYEQRRAKFHKARTASCSSSDASDDDSESRKKRAHKLSAEGKPVSQRRDSHDDSSDSQDPSGGGGAGGGGGGGGSRGTECANPGAAKPPAVSDNSRTTGGAGGGSESRQCSAGRRQRAGRRRAGETRLRESQSLNRITEVQEAEHATPPPLAPPPSVVAPPPKASRGFGARLLHGWTLGVNKKGSGGPDDAASHGGNVKVPESEGAPRGKRDSDEKENCKADKKSDKSKTGKKVRLLGRYFAMHKKLCLPLPGIFGRGRLYKAQSCSSILRERVSAPTTASLVPCEDGWRTERVPRKSDVNRNVAVVRSTPRLDCIVPLVANCPGIKICHIHLGDVSKCCHLC